MGNSTSAAMDMIPGATERTGLFKAAAEGDLELLSAQLRSKKGDLNAKDSSGCTPLHLACAGEDESKHVMCVQHLLKAGAEPDVLNADGDTPLHIASRDGHTHIVRALLDGGSRAFLIFRHSRALSLQFLLGSSTDQARALPTDIAIAAGHDSIAFLLDKHRSEFIVDVQEACAKQLQSISDTLDSTHDGVVDESQLDELVDIIASIRPDMTWKPAELLTQFKIAEEVGGEGMTPEHVQSYIIRCALEPPSVADVPAFIVQVHDALFEHVHNSTLPPSEFDRDESIALACCGSSR